MTSSKFLVNKQSANEPTEPTSAEQAWVKDALQTHLDTEIEKIDFVVSNKLKASRQRALAQGDTSATPGNQVTGWMPKPALVGSAMVVCLALALGNLWVSSGSPEDASSQEQFALSSAGLIEDLNILSAQDDIEFFQSMEFLEWMDNNSG